MEPKIILCNVYEGPIGREEIVTCFVPHSPAPSFNVVARNIGLDKEIAPEGQFPRDEYFENTAWKSFKGDGRGILSLRDIEAGIIEVELSDVDPAEIEGIETGMQSYPHLEISRGASNCMNFQGPVWHVIDALRLIATHLPKAVPSPSPLLTLETICVARSYLDTRDSRWYAHPLQTAPVPSGLG